MFPFSHNGPCLFSMRQDQIETGLAVNPEVRMPRRDPTSADKLPISRLNADLLQRQVLRGIPGVDLPPPQSSSG